MGWSERKHSERMTPRGPPRLRSAASPRSAARPCPAPGRPQGSTLLYTSHYPKVDTCERREVDSGKKEAGGQRDARLLGTAGSGTSAIGTWGAHQTPGAVSGGLGRPPSRECTAVLRRLGGDQRSLSLLG